MKSIPKKIAPCPWCKVYPVLDNTTSFCNFSDKDNELGALQLRATQVIECNNVQCPVRPRISRIETYDALELWNTSLQPKAIARRKPKRES